MNETCKNGNCSGDKEPEFREYRGFMSPYEKICVRLFWRDVELLRKLFPKEKGGYNHHIREAVHKMCNAIRKRLEAGGGWVQVREELDAELRRKEAERVARLEARESRRAVLFDEEEDA